VNTNTVGATGQSGKSFAPSSPRLTETFLGVPVSFSTTRQLLSHSQAHLTWKTSLLDLEKRLFCKKNKIFFSKKCEVLILKTPNRQENEKILAVD